MTSPSLCVTLPNLSYSEYLIIVISIWLILFFMWLYVLIWNIKLNKINEILYEQLHQTQEELERHQSNISSSLNTHHQSASSHLGECGVDSETDTDSPY